MIDHLARLLAFRLGVLDRLQALFQALDRLALVVRPDLKHAAVARPSHRLQPAVFVHEDARLDRTDFVGIVNHGHRRPRLAVVGRALEVHPPTFVFGA